MKKAEATRLAILEKAFIMIYERGYQATSIDEIIANTQVTKGAFYYHFSNKDEMGLAIINELLKPALSKSFTEPLLKEEDPAIAIYKLMHDLLMKNQFMQVKYGCPASNLTQEMSGWNKEFNRALNELTEEWREVLIQLIQKGKKKGLIRNNVNAKQVSAFVMSGYWGIRNFGKLANDRKVYLPYLKELKNYLQGLK